MTPRSRTFAATRSRKRLPPRYAKEPEGQFLERKSCFDQRGRTARPLPWKKIAADIAETLVAFANADGGELVVGLDDDGTPSGIPAREDRLSRWIDVPRARISPPLSARATRHHVAGKTVLVFEVAPSPRVHRTTSGKYVCRVRDQNLPMDAEQIAHLKALKRGALTEFAIIPGATEVDLDGALVRRLAAKVGENLTVRETLLRLRLAETANGTLRLTFAALLLFGKDPERWHPKCYVEFIRFRGTTQQVGRALNIIGRERISAALTDLPSRVAKVVGPHIGRRQILHDLFFVERSEYPAFAWQEAIVNAIAHRDYSLRGTPIEVHQYDDRIEVVSPGELVLPVTIEALQKGGGVHASRNPLIVRALMILGLMREVGEGVRRMFAEMEQNGLRPPEFAARPVGCLTVALRNSPVWDEETRAWLSKFQKLGLRPEQLRLLAFAHQRGYRFTSAQYQRLAAKDIYGASADIKDLIRKGIARPERKGGRIYILSDQRPPEPDDFRGIAPELRRKGFLANADLRRIWGVSRKSAARRTARLVQTGWLRAVGAGRGRHYAAGPNAT